MIGLIVSGKTRKIIFDALENYYYWDKVKYLILPEEVKASDIWAAIKLERKISPYSVSFGEYRLHWMLTNKMQRLLHVFDMNIGGSLQSDSLIPANEKSKYLISSLMEEAIASSQIEGAITTRREAKEMLRKRLAPKNKSQQMIINNYKTIQRISEIKYQPLGSQSILDIHRLITSNTLADKNDEGVFRKSNDVSVVDSTDNEIVFHPPDRLQVEPMVNQLIHFFNEDDTELHIHPIVKACIVHFMIGFIHPFVDGNGRTARALFYWYLLKKGYWLTEYLSISRMILKSKIQYANAYLYTEHDEMDVGYFIHYQLHIMELAFENLREYLKKKLDERKYITEFLKIKNVNYRQAEILKWFYEEPGNMLTVREVQTRLAVSEQSARNDLAGLLSMGFLASLSLNKKTSSYIRSAEFDELLRQKLA
ncbi:MAG: Fic family protein [Chitinophagales bacterium]